MGIDRAIAAFPASIPGEVRSLILEWSDAVHKQLQGKLLSIILFGGVAKGKFEPGRSDINLLVVLSKANSDALEILRAEVAVIEKKGADLSLMTITPDELKAAAEVFPVKLLDMQLHHVVITGSDPLADVQISPERLRRQSIRELLNLQLRMRQIYIERWGEPGALRTFLQQSHTTLFVNLEVLLGLRFKKTYASREEMLGDAEECGISRKALEEALAAVEGKSRFSSEEIKRIYRNFAEQVDLSLSMVEMINEPIFA